MENLFTNINTIITIAAIIFTVTPIWIYVKRTFLKRRVNTSEILQLEKNGLIIKNQELLYENHEVNKLRTIYFPVVPTRKPNIIHLIFCSYLKILIKNGLEVKIFVFDHYYMKLKGKSTEVVKSDVDNFIHVIKGYLNVKNIRFIKESKFIKRKGKRILRELYETSQNLTLGDINEIQKEKTYINNSVVFLRFMKPISNMLYLKQTSRKYGFTLSGLDEIELWNQFEKTRDSQNYKLCNIYIPKIEGLKSASTNVLDTKFNISFGEKFDSVLKKTQDYFGEIENTDSETCIALFLKICVFHSSKKITYKEKENNHRSISSWDALIKELISTDTEMKNRIVHSIALTIHNTLNLKPMNHE